MTAPDAPIMGTVGSGFDAASIKHPGQRAEDRGAQVKSQEIAAAVERLHLPADDPEEPHVAQQVPGIGVQESRRQQFPDAEMMKDAIRRRGEVRLMKVVMPRLISCSSRKTATLIPMIDLQTGETPLNQPDPPVSPR